jgi:hypothetical protein
MSDIEFGDLKAAKVVVRMCQDRYRLAEKQRDEAIARAETAERMLQPLKESALRHVEHGHSVHCFTARNPMHAPRCDCGLDIARDLLFPKKEQP